MSESKARLQRIVDEVRAGLGPGGASVPDDKLGAVVAELVATLTGNAAIEGAPVDEAVGRTLTEAAQHIGNLLNVIEGVGEFNTAPEAAIAAAEWYRRYVGRPITAEPAADEPIPPPNTPESRTRLAKVLIPALTQALQSIPHVEKVSTGDFIFVLAAVCAQHSIAAGQPLDMLIEAVRVAAGTQYKAAGDSRPRIIRPNAEIGRV